MTKPKKPQKIFEYLKIINQKGTNNFTISFAVNWLGKCASKKTKLHQIKSLIKYVKNKVAVL